MCLIRTNSQFVTFDLKLYLGGRNLTDYVDTVYGPMPGRELYSGLTYIF